MSLSVPNTARPRTAVGERVGRVETVRISVVLFDVDPDEVRSLCYICAVKSDVEQCFPVGMSKTGLRLSVEAILFIARIVMGHSQHIRQGRNQRKRRRNLNLSSWWGPGGCGGVQGVDSLRPQSASIMFVVYRNGCDSVESCPLVGLV